MTSRLRELPEVTLQRLAEAVRTGRLGPPWADETLSHAVGGPDWLGPELRALSSSGLDVRALGFALALLVEERADARRRWEGIELTWTGPDDVVTETRDTGAVARQLFAKATSQLLVATYALDKGSKAAALLRVLRERMRAVPGLQVRFFIHLERKYRDDRPEAIVVREHAERFAQEVWPWPDRPPVWFDRRSLEKGAGPRASLHAKCIVQDEEQTLITSANLTEAAQLRNIEAGVLIADAAFARQVLSQFDRLIERGYLVPL